VSDGHDRRELSEWLRDAFVRGATCPPPEVFLADEWDRLGAADRASVEAHLATCTECRAERAMARAFDAEVSDAEAADVDWVVARLSAHDGLTRAGADARATAPTGESSRTRRFSSRDTSWMRLAAALVLLLGGGLLLRVALPPQAGLPAPPERGTVRSAAIEGLTPDGAVPEPPAELRWNPAPGASGYRVRLLGVDDRVLWDARVATPLVELPDELRARLDAGVSYPWTVDALDASGNPMHRSGSATFRIAPPPESSPSRRRSS
jgi:hypothetical protein